MQELKDNAIKANDGANTNQSQVRNWRYEFLWLKLTDGNLVVSVGVATLGLFILDLTGTGQLKVFGLFKLDPWLWLGASLLTATIISFYQKSKVLVPNKTEKGS